MQTSAVGRAGWAVLLLCAAACGEGVTPPPPPPPAVPDGAVLAIFSGNEQSGRVGQALAQPLVVRLATPTGPVADVPVHWTTTQGAGTFSVAGGVTTTNADGRASISFFPTAGTSVGADGAISWITVNALVDGPGATSAVFSFHILPTGVPAEVLIPFGPLFDCTGGFDPSRFAEPPGTIAVGSLVIWRYDPSLHPSCAARLKSTQAPQGAPQIDSGPLAPGQLWGVFLNVAGDYVVQDVNYGGSVTLRVR